MAVCYKKEKSNDVPEIVNSVAKETMPRAIRILDSVVKAADPLGVEVNDKLRFSILLVK